MREERTCNDHATTNHHRLDYQRLLWEDLRRNYSLFSNQNGRVVIQCTRLAVERLGERAFELTKEQWLEQSKSNDNEMTFFVHQIVDTLDQQPPTEWNETDEENE